MRDSQLWVADADGSHRAQLAEDATSADWGADGRSLVVERAGALVVVQADGARERVLTTGTEPAWSSRNRIAFVRGGDLYRIEPSGRGLRQLTASTALESAPAWSPDGRRLAFVATEGVTVDLYVLDLVGGNLTQLTADAFVESSPAWTPDGNAIGFVTNTHGSRRAVDRCQRPAGRRSSSRASHASRRCSGVPLSRTRRVPTSTSRPPSELSVIKSRRPVPSRLPLGNRQRG